LLARATVKSGTEYVCPLTYQPVEGSYAIFASNYGGPKDPAWVANLRANPSTTTEVGDETVPVPVRARITEGSERDAIWARQVEVMPGMGEYTKMTGRLFPIVVLERA
jgi:deazaflavin-dependent oxidoreductase (nitroreductase family)